jgi:hypothetical protein
MLRPSFERKPTKTQHFTPLRELHAKTTRSSLEVFVSALKKFFIPVKTPIIKDPAKFIAHQESSLSEFESQINKEMQSLNECGDTKKALNLSKSIHSLLTKRKTMIENISYNKNIATSSSFNTSNNQFQETVIATNKLFKETLNPAREKYNRERAACDFKPDKGLGDMHGKCVPHIMAAAKPIKNPANVKEIHSNLSKIDNLLASSLARPVVKHSSANPATPQRSRSNSPTSKRTSTAKTNSSPKRTGSPVAKTPPKSPTPVVEHPIFLQNESEDQNTPYNPNT